MKVEGGVSFLTESADSSCMDLMFLDWIFPFFVLGYGALVTLMLSFEPLVKRGSQVVPEAMWSQLMNHRILALICLVVGGLWSLQNIWFKTLPDAIIF